MDVTVIGLGAMGGGMARSLLKSTSVKSVRGYDLSSKLVDSFREEANRVHKGGVGDVRSTSSDIALKDFVDEGTDVVVIVLVNELQCDRICFGTDDNTTTNTNNNTANLESLLKPNSCVVLCSTVSATWSKGAHARFAKNGIQFVDCPISGGPVRSLHGELTLMAAGEERSLSYVKPILEAMGKEIHIIKGGAGMGSTVKMVHQLLAGVHIVAAAEALALASKAGLDVDQMYDIVTGAAGNSWMFQDRGKRMVRESDHVMSALAIFVKDLDIVYKEARRLESPIPIASAALQQFIAGSSMGLARNDDSQVVKVYETLSKTKVAKNNKSVTKKRVQGDLVGDIWKMEDGTEEEIVEVGQEPRHKTVISNEYTRVLKVKFPPKDTTWAHRHAEDSLYFFLVEGGLNVVNHVKGNDPMCDCMEFGEVRYGTHKTDKPLVHKITNANDCDMLCIDAEVIKSPPITSPIPLVAKHHTLIKTRDKCRVYKLTLRPDESVSVSYPFFHLTIVLKGATVASEMGTNGHTIKWDTKMELGDLEWKSPTVGLKLTNTSDAVFEQYIAEWC